MKKVVNIHLTNQDREGKSTNKTNETAKQGSKIITDPMGSWTGVPDDPFFGQPIQDVDDL